MFNVSMFKRELYNNLKKTFATVNHTHTGLGGWTYSTISPVYIAQGAGPLNIINVRRADAFRLGDIIHAEITIDVLQDSGYSGLRITVLIEPGYAYEPIDQDNEQEYRIHGNWSYFRPPLSFDFGVAFVFWDRIDSYATISLRRNSSYGLDFYGESPSVELKAGSTLRLTLNYQAAPLP